MGSREAKFKQTQVGIVPEEWDVKSIHEVAEVVGGGTPPTRNGLYWNGNIAWITPKDLSNHKSRFIGKGERNLTRDGLKNSSAKILPKGAVLLTTRAPVGYLAIAENEVTTNQGFRSLIPSENTTSLYLFYLLKRNVEVLKSNAGGTTFGELSGSRLKSLRFPFPPLREQVAIAKTLSDLDSKIELNQQINETLEAIGKAIFKRWFVDFEFPNEEGKPYKSSGGEMVYNEKVGGEIPKSWKVGTFADLAEIDHGDVVDGPFGSNLKSSDFTETGVRLIHQENVDEFVFVNSKKRYTSNEKADSLLRSITYPGDIVLTKMPEPITRATRIPHGISERFIVMADCIRIRPHKEVSPSEYLLYLINSLHFRKEAESRATGTTRPRINLTQVKSMDVIIPPIEYRLKFSAILEPLENMRETNSLQSQTLMEIRDLLLPKLISGKIRAPSPKEKVEVS